MPRRTPYSHKKKKAQLQQQRSKKRGEEPELAAGLKKKRRQAPGRSDPNAGDRVRALESRFVSLPPRFLERTRDLAFSDPLPRPLPPSSARFPLKLVGRPEGARLTVPSRPKFRYDQTKKELERNEEGVFRKWLEGTREVVDEWVAGEEDGWQRSPSWFETNLEVWRQLWRVIEASAIVLLLIDSRCPPVHCPPSLRAYLRSYKPRRQIILVLTKADLVDPAALEGWRAWLREWWCQGDDQDDVQIVIAISYDLDLLYAEGRTKKHKPAIPSSARVDLVRALQVAHERILQPPAWAVADPAKLADWRPPVRSHVDWAELADDPDSDVGLRPARQRRKVNGDGEEEDEGEEEEEGAESEAEDHSRDPETQPLTIGLVGQPNVGKSSLLNALMGTTRVRASKTPGKTKHFQTILWGSKREIKIVDCPGLVCPSLVPMELQAMAGILPISQIPSLPSCIHFVAECMPIEDMFHVPILAQDEDTIESKKTWREDMPRAHVSQPARDITAGDIMEARAVDRGYLTAKGGRPDSNRAGNQMLRTVADGRVRWGFWPPEFDEAQLESRRGVGVWLGGDPDLSEIVGAQSGSEGEEEGDSDNVTSDWEEEAAEEEESEEESDEEDDHFAAQNKQSFFAALSLGNDEDSDE